MAETSSTTPAPPSANPEGQASSLPVPVANSPAPQNVELVADDDESEGDGDSAFGAGSDNTSVASSILKYRMINGRPYHAFKAEEGVNYIFPNDDRENERLDVQHNIFLLSQKNELYLSPAGKNGHKLNRVLDVGTGTGLWAIEFGMDIQDYLRMPAQNADEQ